MHFLEKEPFVILSANTLLKLGQHLIDSNITHKPVQGRFKGESEVSYYIPYMDTMEALDLARQFNQECILVVNRHREAVLMYTDGSASKEIGYFVQGEDDDNYTIDNNIKYVCTGA